MPLPNLAQKSDSSSTGSSVGSSSIGDARNSFLEGHCDPYEPRGRREARQLGQLILEGNSTLYEGVTGTEVGSVVLSIQMKLQNIRSESGSALYQGKADGDFGPKTTQAIKEFQRMNGLLIDGVVGRDTFRRLKVQL
jgi:murein L,D-transpeptidase YcbB/YkuD